MRLPKFWIDAAAGGGLLLALGVVMLLDRVKPTAATSSTGELPVHLINANATRQGPPKKLRLAVTPTDRSISAATGEYEPWDDMGKLLTQLGPGYKFDVLQVQDIAKAPKILDPYDVLFFTCGGGGEELKDALRGFVGRGGTLYASDFRYDAVAAAFPEMVSRAERASGLSQDVNADVVDPSLRDALGTNKIKLRFDLSQWKVASFAGPRVTPLLSGSYRKELRPNDRVGMQAEGTFLVRFTFGKGTVIFTSFHNEKQNSAIETKLLMHLVFQLVNAGVDAEVTESNEKAGFAPASSNLLSTPKDKPEITKTYRHEKAGTLRFSLAFREAGAKLGVRLVAPDGRTFRWEGTSTLMLEIPDALAGDWTYTVIAKELPFENFPFSVSFGAKK